MSMTQTKTIDHIDHRLYSPLPTQSMYRLDLPSLYAKTKSALFGITILDRISKREHQVDLALELGVGLSTVVDSKKKEFVATVDCLSVSMKERKIMQLADKSAKFMEQW